MSKTNSKDPRIETAKLQALSGKYSLEDIEAKISDMENSQLVPTQLHETKLYIEKLEKLIPEYKESYNKQKAQLAFTDPNIENLLDAAYLAKYENEPLRFLEIARSLERAANRATLTDKTTFKKESLQSYLLEEANRPPGKRLPDIFKMDSIYMQPGVPSILAGYSGVGKSTMALNFVVDHILQKRRVLFYSLEMTPGQLATRLLGIVLKLEVTKFTDSDSLSFGKIKEFIKEDPDYIKQFNERFSQYLDIVSAIGWTAKEITSHYDSYKSENGEPDLVILDYMQIIAYPIGDKTKDKRIEIMETMQHLTAHIATTQTFWLLLAQLNRGAANKTQPELQDLQESSALEQNAGLVLSIYRITNEETDKPYNGVLGMSVMKNRFGGFADTYLNIHPGTGTVLRAFTEGEAQVYKPKTKPKK